MQYQQLAAKYAPTDPEVANTIAQLQLPPDLNDSTEFVPLPSRKQPSSPSEIADAIKEGRRASRRLSILHGWKNLPAGSTSGTSNSGNPACRRISHPTSLSTVLEQDFTVPGKKSDLACPFATMATAAKKVQSPQTTKNGSERPMTPSTNADPTPHQSSDPICAAMYAETFTSPPPSATGSAAAAKCPIRFLDRHSAEEVAQYFETHKHEIPRSHEICVKRYQRNEEDIRKLDAKYGNLVSMLQGLAPIHQPMLPTSEQEHDAEYERRSIEKVQNWATTVNANVSDKADDDDDTTMNQEDDRSSRFDRQLKEVRLGESPSRPWGISVPFSVASLPSSRPAEISPSLERSADSAPPISQVDGSKEPDGKMTSLAQQDKPARPSGQCPFGQGLKVPETQAAQPVEPQSSRKCPHKKGQTTEEGSAVKGSPQTLGPPPTFIQTQDLNQAGNTVPQMVFTGPVFIGYPIDQAMAFMQQHYQNGAAR